MRITIPSNHKPTRKLPEVAKALSRPKLTIRDRDTSKLLFALINAEGVVAHDVHAAGRIGFLVHAAHDLVNFAGRGDVLCAVRVGAGHCSGSWLCARRRAESLD
jgi:hypothetical protein